MGRIKAAGGIAKGFSTYTCDDIPRQITFGHPRPKVCRFAIGPGFVATCIVFTYVGRVFGNTDGGCMVVTADFVQMSVFSKLYFGGSLYLCSCTLFDAAYVNRITIVDVRSCRQLSRGCSTDAVLHHLAIFGKDKAIIVGRDTDIPAKGVGVER